MLRAAVGRTLGVHAIAPESDPPMRLRAPLTSLIRTLTALVLLASAPSLASAIDAPDGRLEWRVSRDGAKIGRYLMTIRHQHGDLIVENEIDIRVELVFVALYRYVHRDREVWRDGRLVELTAYTNDDGTASNLEVEAAEGGLAVDGPSGQFTAPTASFPSGLWQIDMTKGGAFIDVERGRLLSVHFTVRAEEPVAVAGEDVRARHVTASGDISRELWYGPDGFLLRQQFKGPDGTTLEFTRDQKQDGASG